VIPIDEEKNQAGTACGGKGGVEALEMLGAVSLPG